jgi:hypothetical protein
LRRASLQINKTKTRTKNKILDPNQTLLSLVFVDLCENSTKK